MISAGQNTAFSTNKTLNLGGRLVALDVPLVMGILNVTPDSFFDGGRYLDGEKFRAQADRMIREGADIIDVGGYSSRPGAVPVSEEEERARVIPAIQQLRALHSTLPLSIDTFRASIAREAVTAGANLVNDISGGEADPLMFRTVAELQVPYVCMHMRGTPQTMASLTGYTRLVKEVVDYFHKKIQALHDAGVKDIIIDPGFGFAKNVEQNFELLHQLPLVKMLGKPLLVGLSRKSMVWRTLQATPEEALNGTTALHTVALLQGASILRVHDVREVRQVIELMQQLRLHSR